MGTLVTFVTADNAASRAALRDLAARYPEDEDTAPRLVVVVDGADDRQAAALAGQVGSHVLAYADPAGRIADRFGIGVWPTAVATDGLGRVVGFTIGTEDPHDPQGGSGTHPDEDEVRAD